MVMIPTGVRLPKKDEPTSPETADDFRDAFMAHYRKCRRGRMASLRAVYDFSVWFDAAATDSKGGAHAWAPTGMRPIIDSLRKTDGLRWRYKTVRNYRPLARYKWADVAKYGSINKALEGIRAANRTPRQAAELKARKKATRSKDVIHREAIQDRDNEIDRLHAQVRALKERVRVLDAAADASVIEDLEEVVQSHAEAERKANERAIAAELKADAMERRMRRAERDAIHRRQYANRDVPTVCSLLV